MSIVQIELWGRFLPAGRRLCRAAVFAGLICAVLPWCAAARLHTRTLHGVYLTHDSQILQSLARRTPGTYWIDGYRMTISMQTRICWHNSPLQFGAALNRFGEPVLNVKVASPCDSAPPDTLETRMWLQYFAAQKPGSVFSPPKIAMANRIDIWFREKDANQIQAAPQNTRQTLCASSRGHELHYPNEDPIEVVCDAKVNSYIENVFSDLLRPAGVTTSAWMTSRQAPNFFVVKPFRVKRNYDFETIDGSRNQVDLAGRQFYQNPHARSIVREIVYTSDGTVLVPDTALAHLNNEAECAALFAYALAIAHQQTIEHLERVHELQPHLWSLNSATNGTSNWKYMWRFILNINQETLRLGIYRMYMASYDIRYAPFAWSVERGKRIKGPVDAPGKRMPWYAEYGFNTIHQLYPNVDYGKLKTGEAEYAAFLKELRQADPGAFDRSPK